MKKVLFLLIVAVLAAGCIQGQPNQTEVQTYSGIKDDIFACNSQYVSWEGKAFTSCYDNQGNKLFEEPDEQYGRTFNILVKLGFSQDQIL